MKRLRYHQLLALAGVSFALTVAGCGKSGVPRLDVSGAVTFDGQPVPAGELRFEPNVSKGGSGPVGYCSIVHGRFDTRKEDKGPVAGPVRVTVTGYTSAKAFAPQMFPKFTTEVFIEESRNNFDLEVPSS